MNRRWTPFWLASAIVAGLLLLQPPPGESCGECSEPATGRVVRCARFSGGATTGFYYDVTYQHAPWLPAVRVATVKGGPSIDTIECTSDGVLMRSQYAGAKQILWSKISGYIICPLHTERGRTTRHLRGLNPFDALALTAIVGYGWWLWGLLRRERLT